MRRGCRCIGHSTPGVHHMVPCCDKPHVDQAGGARPDDRPTAPEPVTGLTEREKDSLLNADSRSHMLERAARIVDARVADAEARVRAEVEGKVRALAEDLADWHEQGWYIVYPYRDGTESGRSLDVYVRGPLLAALLLEADAPVPQRDADPAPADEQAIRERVASALNEQARKTHAAATELTTWAQQEKAQLQAATYEHAARIAREGGDRG